MYFNFVGKAEQPYDLSPTNSYNTYTFENDFMQQPVQAQLQSPTQRYQSQRHDSLFSYTTSKSDDPSPHQAESQSYFSAAQMTSENHPLRPVNMSRSNSQYATLFNRQQRHSQDLLSYGDAIANSVVDMSRSSTHHSLGRQAAPQPRAQICCTAAPTLHMRRDSTLATNDTSRMFYGFGTGINRFASTTEPGSYADGEQSRRNE